MATIQTDNSQKIGVMKKYLENYSSGNNNQQNTQANTKQQKDLQLSKLSKEASELIRKSAETRRYRESLQNASKQGQITPELRSKIGITDSDTQEYQDTGTYSGLTQEKINKYYQQQGLQQNMGGTVLQDGRDFNKMNEPGYSPTNQNQQQVQNNSQSDNVQVSNNQNQNQNQNQELGFEGQRIYTAEDIQNETDPYVKQQMITSSQNALGQAGEATQQEGVKSGTFSGPVTSSGQANLVSSRLGPISKALEKYNAIQSGNQALIDKYEKEEQRNFDRESQLLGFKHAKESQQIDQQFQQAIQNQKDSHDKEMQSLSLSGQKQLQDLDQQFEAGKIANEQYIQGIRDIESKIKAEEAAKNKKISAINDKNEATQKEIRNSIPGKNFELASSNVQKIIQAGFKTDNEGNIKTDSKGNLIIDESKMTKDKVPFLVNMLAKSYSSGTVTDNDYNQIVAGLTGSIPAVYLNKITPVLNSFKGDSGQKLQKFTDELYKQITGVKGSEGIIGDMYKSAYKIMQGNLIASSQSLNEYKKTSYDIYDNWVKGLPSDYTNTNVSNISYGQ